MIGENLKNGSAFPVAFHLKGSGCTNTPHGGTEPNKNGFILPVVYHLKGCGRINVPHGVVKP